MKNLSQQNKEDFDLMLYSLNTALSLLDQAADCARHGLKSKRLAGKILTLSIRLEDLAEEAEKAE